MNNRILNITETERTRITSMYLNENNFLFDNYLTVDGRFYIKEDIIFDLYEQRELGNIFNFENLKFLFNNVKSEIIDEGILKTINSLKKYQENKVISEAKDYIKSKALLVEQTAFDSVGQWAARKMATNAVTSGKENASVGEMVGDAVLYIARKVKSLLYSVGGMAADAFLVASGFGKTVQWIPWAIVLALDVYQISTGDYGSDTDLQNSSTFWKALNIGFDVLGLLTTGAVAKGAFTLLKPIKLLKTEGEIAKFVAKSPQIKAMLTKINSLLGSVMGRLKQAQQYLAKSPKLNNWFGKILASVPRFLSWLGNMLSRILGAPGRAIEKVASKVGASKAASAGIRSAAETTAMMGGLAMLGGNAATMPDIKTMNFNYNEI